MGPIVVKPLSKGFNVRKYLLRFFPWYITGGKRMGKCEVFFVKKMEHEKNILGKVASH